jgi:hypothetical protein
LLHIHMGPPRIGQEVWWQIPIVDHLPLQVLKHCHWLYVPLHIWLQFDKVMHGYDSHYDKL